MTASTGIPGGPSNTVNAVAYSPAGNLIAAGYRNGQVQLWRPGARLVPLGAPQTASAAPPSSPNVVEFLAFRADGKILASAEDDGTVRLWDITDPAKPRPLAVIHDSATYVFSVAFSRGGQLLAAASADDLVRLWNVSNPARPQRLGKPLPGPTNTAYSVAFSPSGRTLAVGSADRDIRLWDVGRPGPAPPDRPPADRAVRLRVLGRVQPRRAALSPPGTPTAASGCGTSPTRPALHPDRYPYRACRPRLLGCVQPPRGARSRRRTRPTRSGCGTPTPQRRRRGLRDGRSAAQPDRVAGLYSGPPVRAALPCALTARPAHPRGRLTARVPGIPDGRDISLALAGMAAAYPERAVVHAQTVRGSMGTYTQTVGSHFSTSEDNDSGGAAV